MERELSPAMDSEHAEVPVQELANDEISPEWGRDTPIEEVEEKAFPEWFANSVNECIVASAETRTDSQDFDFYFPEFEPDSKADSRDFDSFFDESESPRGDESTSCMPSPQEYAQ